MTSLRPGLLDGRSIAFAGRVPAEVGELVEQLGGGVVSRRGRDRAARAAPGSDTGADEVAMLVGFLCSIAGAYFSGCRFDLQ